VQRAAVHCVIVNNRGNLGKLSMAIKKTLRRFITG
jgi:hypothetical protein